MKLSFKFKPSISKKQLEIVEELSYHTTKSVSYTHLLLATYVW